MNNYELFSSLTATITIQFYLIKTLTVYLEYNALCKRIFTVQKIHTDFL